MPNEGALPRPHAGPRVRALSRCGARTNPTRKRASSLTAGASTWRRARAFASPAAAARTGQACCRVRRHQSLNQPPPAPALTRAVPVGSAAQPVQAARVAFGGAEPVDEHSVCAGAIAGYRLMKTLTSPTLAQACRRSRSCSGTWGGRSGRRRRAAGCGGRHKAVVEVPSPRVGRIRELFGGEGDIVKVGAPLADIPGGGCGRTGTVVGAIPASAAARQAGDRRRAPGGAVGVKARPRRAPCPAQRGRPGAGQPASVSYGVITAADVQRRRPISPKPGPPRAVARRASRHGHPYGARARGRGAGHGQ